MFDQIQSITVRYSRIKDEVYLKIKQKVITEREDVVSALISVSHNIWTSPYQYDKVPANHRNHDTHKRLKTKILDIVFSIFLQSRVIKNLFSKLNIYTKKKHTCVTCPSSKTNINTKIYRGRFWERWYASRFV